MRPLRSARARAALLVVMLVLGLVTGCARARVGLVVQPDDTVDGEIVLATPTGSPPPRITLPPALAGDVDVTGYDGEGYTGSRLRFSGLPFADVPSLTSVAGSPGERVKFGLRRVGNRVLAEGDVDLASVPADRADFQLKITFPGPVLEADGEADGSTVTWRFTPGEKGRIHAVAGFVDPAGPSVALWTALLVLVVAGAAAAVVWLARQDRNPPLHR